MAPMPIGSAYSMMVTGRKYISDGRTSYTAIAWTIFFPLLPMLQSMLKALEGQFSVPIRVSIPIDYTNRARLYNIFSYDRCYHTTPWRKRKLPSEGTPVYIGVELELATDYSIEQLINASKGAFLRCQSGTLPSQVES